MHHHPTLVRDVSSLFRDKLGIEVPSPECDLIENGLLDSLRLVELLLEIEASLGCRIPIDEIELDDLRSVRRIARLIEARTPAHAA
ncbi:MAG TPA: phosphopantetheine-binding protein [Burkholderiales bacterium]|nr:phosphopantetheine-binding protein [Burkholderiales bacterium]